MSLILNQDWSLQAGVLGPAKLSHTFPPGFTLGFRETHWVLSNDRERSPSLGGSALCPSSGGTLTGTPRYLALQSGGGAGAGEAQLTQPYTIQMHRVTAEWAALALNFIPGLLKSWLISQPLLALLLLPQVYKAASALTQRKLHTQTKPVTSWFKKQLLVPLTPPGAFPALSFWSHLPIPRNMRPTILPSDPAQVCRLTSDVTSSRKPLLVLPVRRDLFSFDGPQYSHLSYHTLNFCFFYCSWAFTFLSPSHSGCFWLLGNARSSASHW